METLVGTDGSSGGDAPPKMAKNLKFEPGTLSIFQVSLNIESCAVTGQTISDMSAILIKTIFEPL